jgi:Trypsin-co-occurring domain 1
VTERASQTFEDAVQRRTPAQAIITPLSRMPQAPDEVKVEFGLDLHAEVGAFIAGQPSTSQTDCCTPARVERARMSIPLRA